MARTKALLGTGARLADHLSASLLARVFPAEVVNDVLDANDRNSKWRVWGQVLPFATPQSTMIHVPPTETHAPRGHRRNRDGGQVLPFATPQPKMIHVPPAAHRVPWRRLSRHLAR